MKWFVLLAIIMAGNAMAEGDGQRRRTYANPIDIDYRYNFEQVNEGISYRTGADPAIVRHQGAYYMFQTLADGYWRSTDLIDWTFVTPSRWPFQGIVAPAVWSGGARLYIMPSTMEPEAILASGVSKLGRIAKMKASCAR